MIRRFIYPRVDMFYKNRGMMKNAIQLAITSETDDGKSWFGTREAIENYCEEYGIEINNVEWLVKLDPNKDDFAKINAKDFDDWERQYNSLKIKYKEIPEEKW